MRVMVKPEKMVRHMLRDCDVDVVGERTYYLESDGRVVFNNEMFSACGQEFEAVEVDSGYGLNRYIYEERFIVPMTLPKKQRQIDLSVSQKVDPPVKAWFRDDDSWSCWIEGFIDYIDHGDLFGFPYHDTKTGFWKE